MVGVVGDGKKRREFFEEKSEENKLQNIQTLSKSKTLSLNLSNSPVSCWNSGISSAIVSSGLYLRLKIIAHPELEQPLAES